MEELVKNWSEILSAMRAKIGDVAFDTWFGPIKSKFSKPNAIIIEVPDDFFRDWFVQHYLDLLKSTIITTTNTNYEINILVNPDIIKKDEKARLQILESRLRPHEDNLKLNPKYTFENFVVGPSNRFTHAASLAVAESPGKSYNPLFIYGGVGLGKTHLMQAICHCIKKKSAATKIYYMPSEKFTNELIDAIQHRSTQKFRQKYRNVDVLVVDDVHFLAGKESTQEEFFHTFNALYDAHKQIVISSDRPPKEIANLEDRLSSRFSWGLITDIQPPDLETRVAILKKKIEHENISISDNVLFFIAESITNNIRELEGALIRIVAYSLLENKQITLALAQDVLKDMFRASKKTITAEDIQNKVAGFFNIGVVDFKSKKRNKNVVLARQIAMFLCRELTSLSLLEIGLKFGGKDHTTVLHSYNKIKELINSNYEVKRDVERIKNDIQSYS